MFTWKRSVAALAALGVVMLVIVAVVPVSASPGGPLAVSGQEMDGKVVVSWLPPEGPPAVINQTGCDSMNMSMSYVYQNFTSLYPNITVVLRGGGNDVGFSNWINGTSDINQASRAITAQERQAAEAKGINVTDTKVGVESVAVIADPRAGVTELSFEQLKGLLNGSIANWNEVGGNDLAVKVLMPPARGSPYLFIYKGVMGETPFAPTATTVDDGRTLVDMVANTSGAVGFTRAGFVNSSTGVECLGIKRTADSKAFLGNDTAAAYNGSYVLSRYFRLYTDGLITGAESVWAAFVLDPLHGQSILKDNGFLPLTDQDRENSTANLDMGSEMQFQVVRQSSDGSSTAFEVNGTRFVDSNVTAGTTYTYTVSSLNGTGEGTGSSTVNVTVAQPGGAQAAPLDSPTSAGIFVLAVIGLAVAAAGATMLILRRR